MGNFSIDILEINEKEIGLRYAFSCSKASELFIDFFPSSLATGLVSLCLVIGMGCSRLASYLGMKLFLSDIF